MAKQSLFNIWEGNILYNSYSDTAIEFQEEEVSSIKFYLENLNSFEKNYPEIFDRFSVFHFVIPDDLDEIEMLMYKNKKKSTIDRNYHITINPTLQCNYRCWYCCVEEQNTQYEKRRMDNQTILNVSNHITNIIHKNAAQSFHLDWFGGEPLMYFKEVVFPISMHSLELCKRNNIPFSNHITTNAYYIDEKMLSYFNEIKLNSFQIPIDGNEKKHNSVKNMNGVGHFRKIIKTINLLCENIHDVIIILRINYDKETLDNIKDIIPYISQNNRNSIFVDLQRVWQVQKTNDNNGNNSKLIEVKRVFEESGFNVDYYAFRHKGYLSCYADNYYHQVINYDGKVYKCSAKDYSAEICIGELMDSGNIKFNEAVMSKYFSHCTFDNETCRNCKILPLCYGPCIQKCFDNHDKNSFQCLYETSELSLKWYIHDKVRHQNESLNKYMQQ